MTCYVSSGFFKQYTLILQMWSENADAYAVTACHRVLSSLILNNIEYAK